MTPPVCDLHRGARMLLRPQPIPAINGRHDRFTEAENKRRRMWVCRVAGCPRIKLAEAAEAERYRCSGCGNSIDTEDYYTSYYCKACDRKGRARQ